METLNVDQYLTLLETIAFGGFPLRLFIILALNMKKLDLRDIMNECRNYFLDSPCNFFLV